jgi:3-oxoacyl-[acyl-carrier-protein] synthase I
VATHLSGVRPHGCLEAPLPGKRETAPVLFVPVADLEGLQTPFERISVLAEEALKSAADQLPEEIPAEAILILTLIPSPRTPRGANLDPEELQRVLAACHPGLTSACFRFAPIDQGAVETLDQVRAELQEGKCQAVIFGGVDSLVDMVSLSERVNRGEAMIQGAAEGTLPGEGAAYLVLQNQPTENCRARLDALSTTPEPHHGQAHDKPLTGMSAAIQQVLQNAGITADNLDSIVLPFEETAADSLEWHQVLEAVWSRKENVPRTFEVLHPAASLGDTGAAALPLALALGCARFEFEFTKANRLLVCANRPFASRGAVLLKAGVRN